MKKIKLTKLIKQLNAAHEPPEGWQAHDLVSPKVLRRAQADREARRAQASKRSS